MKSNNKLTEEQRGELTKIRDELIKFANEMELNKHGIIMTLMVEANDIPRLKNEFKVELIRYELGKYFNDKIKDEELKKTCHNKLDEFCKNLNSLDYSRKLSKEEAYLLKVIPVVDEIKDIFKKNNNTFSIDLALGSFIDTKRLTLEGIEKTAEKIIEFSNRPYGYRAKKGNKYNMNEEMNEELEEKFAKIKNTYEKEIVENKFERQNSKKAPTYNGVLGSDISI
jgi:hypothetical protein